MPRNNIIKKEILRQIQGEALNTLAESVGTSFGPMGGDSEICKDEAINNKNANPVAHTMYSKDGHTILQSINFDDIISDGVKYNLNSITTNVVKKVGDGTTSAVIMSNEIFKRLRELEEKHNMAPRLLVNRFEAAVKLVQDKIKTRKQEFNADIAYKIAYISSNANEEVANDIYNIYKEFGNDVFIEVASSTTAESVIHKYDGMSIDTGYDNPVYINNYTTNDCTIERPRIYYFRDPLDTSEMLAYFISIIEKNIVSYYQAGDTSSAIPTVILCKHISRDISVQLNPILQFMNQFSNPEKAGLKPKLLVVNNIHQDEALDDIAVACGCPAIGKFNDIKEQERLQEEGKAPTVDTIADFYGTAEMVRSNTSATVVKNPANMYDEEGNLSPQYKATIDSLKAQLQDSINAGEDINTLAKLKKRINSLNAKCVEYRVGGVTPAARDAVKYLVEDAVLNCRSASEEGVGYAANAEGYIAITDILESSDYNKELEVMLNIIKESYIAVITRLYETCITGEINMNEALSKIKEEGPLNVVTGLHDKNILSSISTDGAILETISRVITLMITCTQCILPTSNYNKYDRIVIE